MTTFLAAAGEPDIAEKCLKGHSVGDKKYKVRLDGYNLLPSFQGEAEEWPRKEFMYWSDDGDVLAMRYEDWKIVFREQRAHGFGVWTEPFVELRVPGMYQLRADPFERGDESLDYRHWVVDHAFLIVPAAAYVGQWLQSFREFPPRMTPASFNLEKVMEEVQRPANKA